MNTEEYLTIADACRILKMNKQGIQRLTKLGLLKFLRPTPRKTYFTKQMIDDYANGIFN